MSNYPTSIDTDVTLPPVNNNLSDIGEDAVNALRDAVFNVENALGTNIAGTLPSLAARLGVFINGDGTPNALVLNALGFITLPLYNNQVAAAAGIEESKLLLDYPTANLFNYIRDLSQGVNTAVGWINVSGVKLEPHLMGAIYRHNMTQIDVIETTANYLNNVFRVSRDNINAFLLANDMNNELTSHQWADGSPVPYPTADGSIISSIINIITNSGATYPSNYSHLASAIYLNTSGYIAIPPTTNNLQLLADYIDNTSILLLGSRIQNLYASGISVNSRSSTFAQVNGAPGDGYGNTIVYLTPAITYLGGQLGIINNPYDNFQYGDDLIQLMPTSSQTAGNVFDAQFALIRTGDKISVGYDGYNISAQYVILEKKYVDVDGYESYFIRIAGKNLAYDPNATVIVNRPLFNNNKYGVLSVANATPTGSSGSSLLGASISPSLIIGNPDGAQCTGVGFNPNQFDVDHYLLYIILYPNGNPLDGYTILSAIDVTGNMGTTPGSYTLESIVGATNAAFRQPGYNYRFTAFQYQGEFGIIMDPYNNASFSIVDAVVINGSYHKTVTQNQFSNNVIDVFTATGIPVGPDPLGFGPAGAGISSPPYNATYDTTASASGFPTQIFTALQSNNYYVNGAERSTLNTDIYQSTDIYGDGYWVATIYQSHPGLPGQVSVIYTIPLDLQSSQLKAGKTIVVQPYGTNYGIVNYGRFIIQAVSFSGCPINTCQITVYDAVHASGSSPQPVAPNGSQVAIYFSSDSVSFDSESATDNSPVSGTFKRYFEIYTDYNGNTYTHERARIPTSGNITVNYGFVLQLTANPLAQMNIVNISPTLRGDQSGTTNYTNIYFTKLSTETGAYTGYLQGASSSAVGPTTTGYLGEITRFYDANSIDYIDIKFPFNNSLISDFTSTQNVTVQLFPSLALDQEVMLLASCQENTATGTINEVQDLREFGNISQEQLTTSAIDFISAGDRWLHFNGVIRGFDIFNDNPSGVTFGFLSIDGGLALVDGNLLSINDQTFTIPAIAELYNSNTFPINFALCLNSDGELTTLVLTDYDTIFTAGTPNAGDRVVTVVNQVAGNSYNVASANFSYILNDRKDLTLLYIVSSTVSGTGTGATTTITTHDVRRFVNDADSGIAAIVTDDQSQGNFRTLSAASNWLLFNGAYQNTIEIKGSHNFTATDYLPAGVQIIGAGTSSTLTVANTVSISNITFSNLTIQVNTYQGFTLGSNVIFDNCNFIYNSNANSGTPPVPYVVDDWVNAGSGMIYCAVGPASQLTNVAITNCTFTNNFANHFSFISIQLGHRDSVAQEINISNNTFLSPTVGDIRGVIAFSSTLTGNPSGEYPLCPKIINVSIDNNICNQDQLIIISAALNPNNNYMTYTCLSAINSTISGNICGTIGHFTQINDTANISNNYTNGTPLSITSQFDSLSISNNTCHYITNLDITGAWVEFLSIFGSAIESVTVQTGQVDIIGNITSWIHAGAFSSGSTVGTGQGKGVRILQNKINPYNSSYLSNYTNYFSPGPNQPNDTPPNIAIYLIQDKIAVGNAQSIISENMIVQNPSYTNAGALISTPYYYDNAIYCENNAHIVNNTIVGVININANNNGSGRIIYLGTGGATYIVQGNILNRNGVGIGAYIDTLYTSSTSSAVITDNFFNSTYVDVANTIYNDANINSFPPTWTYYHNTNQIDYSVISFLDATIAQGDVGTNNTSIFISTNSAYATNAGFITELNPTVNPIGNLAILVGSGIPGLTATIVSDIGSKMPPNVTILASKLGLASLVTDSGVTDTTNTFSVYITTQKNIVGNGNNMNFNFPTNTILDPHWSITPGTYDSTTPTSITLDSGTLVGLQTATTFLSMDPTNPNNFITGKHNILCHISLNITLTSGIQTFLISPLVVQFYW